MFNGSITLDELRENRDNQYLDVKQASVEHYTEELIELLGEGYYALCYLLFLTDNSTPLHDQHDGLLYDMAVVPKIIRAFAATDLKKLVHDIGYYEAESQEGLNTFLENLNHVHKLFEFAEENKLNVIGFTL
ncbi:hypothetical protein JCM18903_2764 [Psychrobacter sp. JCM 18903]|jgi:hypothetical protein|uniref:hypothetical protein n=1 Tax=Psychrobacter TaxID=497 RepID=UPI000433D55D|nr:MULTISPECIES: hypothetical protein [unclassified Psychrobacter]GAF62668.1 hypothetical protein JCM18903_2764 [Psychrobacter sp. JCM 18903]